MGSSDYTYSPKASVFRKTYDTVNLTIILEEKPGRKSKKIKKALQMLKNEIDNFLNDTELEEIFQQPLANNTCLNQSIKK